jgi:hypothetical protein
VAVDYTMEDAWTLPGNNAIDGRFHDGAFLAMGGNVAAPLATYRDGVIPSCFTLGTYWDLAVVQDSPTPGMAVKVNLGQAVISRAGQGPYIVTLRSTGRVDVNAASVSNPRRDLVVAQLLDTSIGDAEQRARVFYVPGVAAGSPTLPAVPTGAIPLAELQVAANATQITTANIIDMRKAAGLRGAVQLMLPGDAHADAGSMPGNTRYCRTHERVEVWKADGVWHGLASIPYSANLGADHALRFGESTIMTLAIPDPGFPYQLETSMDWHGLAGSPVTLTVGCYVTDGAGAALTRVAVYPAGSAGDSGIAGPPAASDLNFHRTGLSATRTGATTIAMVVKYLTGSAGYRSWATGTGITATVVPV